MPEKIHMKFNGREIEVDAGTPLIDLSKELGEEIPHFCYHPGIGVDGNCRLCLVELEGAPKLVPACTLKAGDGMEVRANTEKVIKARQGVLEFLLINHPLDCPICDKGGECPLQDYTRLHGSGHSRMGDEKNLGKKHHSLGEYIMFDSERCVTCTRCVRFMRDVVGRDELFVRHRGDRSMISVFQDGLITSGFTGNLADVCPVGALTSKDFRFEARPWELKKVESACGECSLQCAASSWWKNDEVMRMTPDLDHTVNSWWLCDRGRFDYPTADPESQHLVKRQGESVSVSAAEAGNRAAELISASGAKTAILVGSRATNEELDQLSALQAELNSGLNPLTAAPEREFFDAMKSAKLEIESLSSLDHFDRAIVLGVDPELSHPILGLRLAAPGGPAVTLVHEGANASVSEFTRSWKRVEADPGKWVDGADEALAGEDSLLVAVSGELLRNGTLDAELVKRLETRKGETRVIVLLEGLNRRGLVTRPANGASLVEALDAGEVDALLLFGLDPSCDLADVEDWEDKFSKAGKIILQSHGLSILESSAEVVLERRRAVDLEGTITNTFGLLRTLKSWQPVAGIRQLDLDWLASIREEVVS
jgi:NADH-quinone oxidoreductase subunit G